MVYYIYMKWTTLKVKPDISRELTRAAREHGLTKQDLTEQLFKLDIDALVEEGHIQT